jgi:hypothetical protein
LSTIRRETAKEVIGTRSQGNDVAAGQKECLQKVKGNTRKRDEVH